MPYGHTSPQVTGPGIIWHPTGTLIRLQVDYLPGDRAPRPLWLWCSRTGAAPAEVDRCWQAFLRRFDLEHTFRLFKTGLGLDHFEGRSFTGWHRHVTLAALAQAFCTLLRSDPKVPAPG